MASLSLLTVSFQRLTTYECLAGCRIISEMISEGESHFIRGLERNRAQNAGVRGSGDNVFDSWGRVLPLPGSGAPDTAESVERSPENLHSHAGWLGSFACPHRRERLSRVADRFLKGLSRLRAGIHRGSLADCRTENDRRTISFNRPSLFRRRPAQTGGFATISGDSHKHQKIKGCLVSGVGIDSARLYGRNCLCRQSADV